MRFVPYHELGTTPNIIVDGATQEATRLTLSHWPRSGTPQALLRDTSAAIVFAWQETPGFEVVVEAASNNHFDEDGLIGLHALLDPGHAASHRQLLEDAAYTGDFGVMRSDPATRLCLTIAAHADPATSPFPAGVFDQPYPRMAAELYQRLLELMPRFIAEPDHYREAWSPGWQQVEAGRAALASGAIRIEEEPELDLAIVHLPDTGNDPGSSEFGTLCHPYVLYSANGRNRVLLIRGRRYEFRYRYESWVQMVSMRPPARVALDDLVAELNDLEGTGATWQADGVGDITPRVFLGGEGESDIGPEEFLAVLRRRLRGGAPAWDPYGPT